MDKYNHQEVEKKWQKKWKEAEIFKTDFENSEKEKFYLLDMFPYPSGDGLHMGHVEGYSVTDTFYRYKKMQGFNLLHPQGFDGFGLPAENYAIKTGVHPSKTTKTNGDNYLKQWNSLGMGHDFSNIDLQTTSNPDFYKHTQWLFGKFMEVGIAYKKTAKANWCSSCQTIIANEQIENGACERCKTEIEQKDIPSWMFKITDFADDLIWTEKNKNIDWPEYTKINQNNWIGKSEGAEIDFQIKHQGNYLDKDIKIFTTRPDTIFGATYMVLAPEHDLVKYFLEQDLVENPEEIREYLEQTKKKTELERLEGKSKTGVLLKGITATNPATEKSGMDQNVDLPIYISDYVLAGYGTGAIMAVPAHDERDFEFAKKFGIEIKEVIIEKILLTKEQKQTINVYNKKVKEVSATYNEELSEELKKWIDLYLNNLNSQDVIFEIGSGTGKDAKYIESRGFKVERSDISYAFVELLKKEGCILFNPNIDSFGIEKYNSIFANASLLHSTKKQLPIIFKKINRALKNNGFFAFTVKRGDGEILSNHRGGDRFFALWQKNELMKILEESGFQVLNFKEGEKWLNIIVRKINNIEIFSGNGILVNSREFDGMDSEEAKKKITEFVGGKMTSTYRLRDWSISRQRYWGTPIPVVYDPEGEAHFVGEENLPWILPTDVDFVPTGEAPLAKSKELKERVEKIFGKGWTPEYDTMDTFVDSAWYFLRYCDPENEKEFASRERLKKWMPVDLYIGGAEHTYMHLLFARFFVKAMKKIGLVDFGEPFLKLRHQGMVNDKDGKKMSKSKGNVINPDEMVERFGADATRTYMLFSSPLEDDVIWNEDNIVGVYRFLEKVWRQQEKVSEEKPGLLSGCVGPDVSSPASCKTSESKLLVKRELHKTIKSVTEKIEDLKFNTAISDMMKFINFVDKQEKINKDDFLDFIKILSPFAPHIADEILGEFNLEKVWPKFDPELAKNDTVKIGIQVNGKRRAEIELAKDAQEREVKEKVLAMEEVQKWAEKKEPKKFIYVPGKIISIIV